MRLSVLDARGDLRVLVSDGGELIDDASFETAREALDRKATSRRPARSGRGEALSIPFVSRGSAFGVLDVVAPPDVLDERWDTLDAVVSQVALALSNVTARSELERDREAMRKAAALAARLSQARTREEALREIVRGLHQDLGLRSAAWLADGGVPFLVSARGIGSGRRDRLRANAALRPGDLPAQLASIFASVTASHDPDVIAAGDTIVVMDAAHDPQLREAVTLVQVVSGQVLGWLSSLEHLRRRTVALDTALTLTAHELRGPVLAAKATIDGMLQEAGRAADDRARLRDSRRQLEELADIVDPLLRWSVSGDRLQRRAGDLVALVARAIDSVVRETGEDRVMLEVPLAPMRVPIARRHLSFAIRNLIRNAIAFSPPGSVVAVRVVFDEATATISVRDEGIGVAAEEVDSIFEPFARGRSGRSLRAGNGLGLFVVQRVADSHGGRVWVESGEAGTTFHLTLPLRSAAGERKEGSPSKR
ncbi:MAG: sensor histidine kinase [Actinomycetota bacterium]